MDVMTENAAPLSDRAEQKSFHIIVQTSLIVFTTLAILYTLYLCKVIIVPFVVSAFLALLLSPIVRAVMRMHIPKLLACVIVVGFLLSAIGSVGSFLVEPAGRWLSTVPVHSEKIAFELEEVTESLGDIKDEVLPETKPGESGTKKALNSSLYIVLSSALQSALVLIVQMAAIVVITFFFLVFGEELLRNVVKVQNTFARKKLTVVMFQTVRDDVSYYVLVISSINVCLGLATAGAMALLGVKDPLLWGALATLLNFAPYLGPLLLMIILSLVGYLQYDDIAQALLAPGAFLVLNILEGQFITPAMLGRRFNINPLVVVLWMFLWSWLWGAAGLLLAIPMLMCFKIALKHTSVAGDWGDILNGHAVLEQPEHDKPAL